MYYSCQKYTIFDPKKDCKIEEELTCALKNDVRNVEHFDPTLKSLKICTLMGSF